MTSSICTSHLGISLEHKVFLYHHPNVFYWVRMFGGPDGDVLCTPVRATPSGEELCPWPDCVQEGNRLYCEYIEGSWRECQLRELELAQAKGKKVAEELDENGTDIPIDLLLPDFPPRQETD